MKSRTDRTWGCKYQTWFPDDPLAMDSWADGSPTDLEQQPLVTDYSLAGPQPWVLPMCKQLGRASRYDRSWGCHVDCVKWGKVMRKCFVKSQVTQQMTSDYYNRPKPAFSVGLWFAHYYFDSSLECELNRKDIWFNTGKKSKQPVYGASILHQPLPWTLRISLFQSFAVWWGRVIKRQT